MDFCDLNFVQGFIRLTSDAFVKGWHERNGGNLSYRLTAEETRSAATFCKPLSQCAESGIGCAVPALAGETFLVTGSGRYMRNIALDAEANIALITINSAGTHYAPRWGLCEGGRPTSELPTHLLNHEAAMKRTDGLHRVIYHAHPANSIALTFILPPNDRDWTLELWEAATECPVVFPEGVGYVGWMVPGGAEIGMATAQKIARYNVVIWAHHGVFCSGGTFDETFGLMDTVEKAAEIAVKVRSMGAKRQTITGDDFTALAKAFNVKLGF
ncbi:MAG: rhamnulose-1-phosphate aldolase [Spirochaetaceae bacterium]|jgi:rhamnulose-1-phosphate aldolase|nr:rhamnulose-1-phosphate aldolase [Spirochaetaceae bacterium]